ncbi:serine/threonine protein kinase [Xanthomonas arboricola]|uniref:class III lanthionine synthetase LanKC n=1 Tax=Xanthomonas arboricola TaxID=56448 RepID=UPI0011B0A7A1|nr:class III lanthionine synthetase LanKC [Xanthomonas arboricola]
MHVRYALSFFPSTNDEKKPVCLLLFCLLAVTQRSVNENFYLTLCEHLGSIRHSSMHTESKHWSLINAFFKDRKLSYFEHSLVRSRFFEPIDAYKHSDDWQSRIRAALPADWQFFRSSYWLQAIAPGVEFPDQGFKLHVAPDYARIAEQVDKVLEVLIELGASFKIVADDFLVELTNSKNFPRTASGKFVTIYPVDDAHFERLANALTSAMHGFNGPYILTDRRVPGSDVVFYRYGGLRSIVGSTEDGRAKHLIRSPDGELVEDRRDPWFFLPPWVPDPFEGKHPAPLQNASDDPALQGRFEVESALHFSNSGGVYKAKDRHDGQTVVLKEARPRCGLRSGGAEGRVDAQQALAREFEILRRLEDLGCAPKPIQLFQEWEHLFLAQELIDCPTWQSYFAREEIFLGPFVKGWCRVESFLQVLPQIVRNAVEMLRRVHANGVVLGDLSPNNIMVNPDDFTIRIIDVESASLGDQESAWNTYWATRGYGRADRMARTEVSPLDDWYALGKCVMSSVISLEGLTIAEGNEERLSDLELAQYLVDTTGLPHLVIDVITALLNGDPDSALTFLQQLQDFIELPPPQRRLSELVTTKRNPLKSRGSVDLNEVADFVSETYRGSSRTEFWPGDPGLYASNMWNLAHGAAGVVAFLDQMQRDIPDRVDRVFRSAKLVECTDDIGLYTGLSGISAFAAMRGNYIATERAVEKISESPFRYRGADIASGEAGVGVGMLSLLRLTGSERARASATESFRYLQRTAIQDAAGSRWLSGDAKRNAYFGYARGGAGIAFFLAQYAVSEKSEEAAVLAADALRFVISNALVDKRGSLQWTPHADDTRLMPYWSHGAGGIGAVLLRVGMQLDEPLYVDLARSLAGSAFSKLSVCVGQFDGLGGCLEFQSDLVQLTGLTEAAFYQEQLVEGIGLYSRRTPEGVAFPGNFAMRLSCDFATGSAGVGMALRRATLGGSRTLMDFALPSAELFGQRAQG